MFRLMSMIYLFLIFCFFCFACNDQDQNDSENNEMTSNTVSDDTVSDDTVSDDTVSDDTVSDDTPNKTPTQDNMPSVDIPIEGCPPEGPYGTSANKTAADITLYQCDGTAVNLHSLCSKPAVYLYTYAEWCSSCTNFAKSDDPNAIYNKYKDENFVMWFIITEKSDTTTPSRRFCQSVKEQFGLEMNVLFDIDGATTSVLGMPPNSTHMLLGEKNKIIASEPGAFFVIKNGLEQIYGF
jgi:hypothetical protein